MSALADKVALVGWLIKGIGSIAGLAAPTIALVRLGELPDYLEDTALIILPSVTGAMIIAIMILGTWIARIGGSRAAMLVLGCAAGGAILTTSYAMVTHELVIGIRYVDLGSVQREIRPLSPSPQILEVLEFYGGDYRQALISEDGSNLKTLMRARNLSATVLILVTMVLSQLLLAGAIVGGAWWLAERDGGAWPPRSRPPSTDGDDIKVDRSDLSLGDARPPASKRHGRSDRERRRR